MTAAAFAPFQTVAAQLLPHALEPSEDGAHDLSHLQRVWHNVRLLHRHEGADLLILLAATLLHDCVAVEKIHRCAPRPLAWQRIRHRHCCRH